MATGSGKTTVMGNTLSIFARGIRFVARSAARGDRNTKSSAKLANSDACPRQIVSSLVRSWIFGGCCLCETRSAFRNFSAACCAWNTTISHGGSSPALIASTAIRSCSAFRTHADASAESLIQNLAFRIDIQQQVANPAALRRDLLRRGHEDVKPPEPKAEQAQNFNGAIDRSQVRFHFDEQVDVALGAGIATSLATEQHDALRMKCVDDATDDVVNQLLIDNL